MNYVPEHLERFLHTLHILAKEGALLAGTRKRLFSDACIDAAWVSGLDDDDYRTDVLESFVSRFGRMQDTIGDKLLPRLALLEGERRGTAIENYNRAERQGLIRSADDWLVMRSLRNKLVHEYIENVEEFVNSLHLANKFSDDLFLAYANVRQYVLRHLQIPVDKLPPPDLASRGCAEQEEVEAV